MANVYIKSDKPNKQFLVIEQASELILNKFQEYNDARTFAKIQNSGGGFNGFTPPFVLTNVKGYLK